MKKLRMLLFFFAPVLTLLLLGSPATAQAAQTWMPKFDPARHCYIDPSLDGSVNLSGCESALQQKGAAHGYQYYFIMTTQGSEPNGSTTGQKFGAWKLDQYVLDNGAKI